MQPLLKKSVDDKLQEEKIHSKLDSKYLMGAHFKYDLSDRSISQTSAIRRDLSNRQGRSWGDIDDDGCENIDLSDTEESIYRMAIKYLNK